MQVPEIEGNSSWSSGSDSDYSGSVSSSVLSSDLDEFIMTTSQSAALSRQRKKKIRSSGLTLEPGLGEELMVKKKKRKPSTIASQAATSRVSVEVRDLLGRANNAYLKRDYDNAVLLLEEAIRQAPGLADPFVTLGAIYEEQNDPKRSLEALLVAVHLTPGDKDLWARVALMSQAVGNADQAIYCLKRCVKSSSDDEQIGFVRDLANVYMQTGRYHEICHLVRRFFAELAPTDPIAVELGTVFAKALYNTNEKPEAMAVLEKILFSVSQPDANLVNMLAEVYLDIREWAKGFQLLVSMLDLDHLDDPEKCPVDLVVKLALAVAPTYDVHKELVDRAVRCLQACPIETHADLYTSLADGFIANGLVDLAVGLLEESVESIGVLDEGTQGTLEALIGKCYYVKGDFGKSGTYLGHALAHGSKVDPDVVVMLADSWRQLGRESEAGELLLSKLTYDDLQACRILPTATSTTQRKKSLDQIQHLISNNPESGDHTIRSRFAHLFLELLNDCELDIQRIARHQRIEGATPAWKVRKELDLENVEDWIGSESFVRLLIRGSRICAMAGRAKEAVDLVEAVLHNKRKKWGSNAGAEKYPAELENLSYELSIVAGLNKVTIKYLRQHVVDLLGAEAKTSLSNNELILKKLSAMTKLVFKSRRFSHREFIDQRSWLVRQACRYPAEFALCMFAGHACMHSQSFRFAAQEYARSHKLAPNDPWPLLCLGSALLSLAMSRTTRDKQLTVLKAFGVLQQYQRVRHAQQDNTLSETTYNMARGFHQLGLFAQADREYRKVLAIGGDTPITRAAAYNLSLIRQRANREGAGRLLEKYIVAREKFMFGSIGSSPFGASATTAKNANTNNSTEVPSGPSDTVSCLVWAPQANFLAGSSWDKQVRIWEVSASMGTNTCTATARVSYSHDSPVLSCAFSFDGATVFSGGCDNKLKAYNLQGQRDQIIGQHDMPISSVHWVEELKMVITAGWDKTIRFWTGTSPTPALTLQLPERCYSMDVKYPLLVCACAEKHVVIYNLQTIQHNQNPFKTIQSPLRLQTRVVNCFPDKTGFAIGSIEGRVHVSYVDDVKKDENFAFKCHRTSDEIFPVNVIDFHPFFEHSFATAGGDGTFSFWDKAARQKLKAFNSCNYPITAGKFNQKGDMFAYAVGYDWSKGFENNQASIPKKVFVHRVQEIEVKPKPGTGLNAFPKRR